MLCTSGLTLEAEVPDAFDVVVGARGELTIALLSLKSPPPKREEAESALETVRAAIRSGSPIYDVVSAVRAWTAAGRNRRVALTLVRFSQPDSRVEILNAGMPAVACLPPGGRLALHPALSRPIGERFGEVHPYELCPLAWGSTWFLLSEGASLGSIEPDAVRTALAHGELLRQGPELAASPPAALAPWIERMTSDAAPIGDATLVVAHADPTRRFESGIRS